MRPLPRILLFALLAALLAAAAASAGDRGAAALPGDDPLRSLAGDWPDGGGSGPGGGYIDTTRWQKEQAERAYGQQVNRLNFMTSRLEAGKNPRAFQVADEIRNLLAQARTRIDQGNYKEAFSLLSLTNGLFAELSRLAFEVPMQDPNRPATSQNALAEAAALHQRLQDHLFRLRDRPGLSANDEKARQLQAKVQELLDKCKESLAAGRADAAKEFGLKAEALLAELHQAIAGGAVAGIDPSRRRLEERLQRDADLIRRRMTKTGEGGDADRLALAGSLLEQARAALHAGNLESAEGLAKHAEKILSEPRSAAGGRLSAAAFDRLQGKLDRAGAIVKAAGNEKASRILEKGLEHFGKAERFRSEGQKARAEAEMDIALKLAAKAVDIARAADR